MKIKSFAFNNNDTLPPRYKGNLNPPFDISDVPSEAKSLALIMHDPDAVSGDFVHWAIWDIDPQTTEILEGGAPSGSTEGPNSSGIPGYFGPKPPTGSGTHHYTFELYALDTMLDLLPTTRPEDLAAEIAKHQIAHASIIGTADA
jgi:Raf kinase inhibitor-like YbhB/YbcL family protein